MRQAGHMAAAGLVALKQMMPRLSVDQSNAQYLITKLKEIDERLVDPESGFTNVVKLDFSSFGISAQEIVDSLLTYNIKVKLIGQYTCRMITHYGIERPQIDFAVSRIEQCLAKSCRH